MGNLYVMEHAKRAARRSPLESARVRRILSGLCRCGMVLGFVGFIVFAGGESDGGFYLGQRLIGIAVSVGVMIGCGWLESRVE